MKKTLFFALGLSAYLTHSRVLRIQIDLDDSEVQSYGHFNHRGNSGRNQHGNERFQNQRGEWDDVERTQIDHKEERNQPRNFEKRRIHQNSRQRPWNQQYRNQDDREQSRSDRERYGSNLGQTEKQKGYQQGNIQWRGSNQKDSRGQGQIRYNGYNQINGQWEGQNESNNQHKGWGRQIQGDQQWRGVQGPNQNEERNQRLPHSNQGSQLKKDQNQSNGSKPLLWNQKNKIQGNQSTASTDAQSSTQQESSSHTDSSNAQIESQTPTVTEKSSQNQGPLNRGQIWQVNRQNTYQNEQTNQQKTVSLRNNVQEHQGNNQGPSSKQANQFYYSFNKGNGNGNVKAQKQQNQNLDYRWVPSQGVSNKGSGSQTYGPKTSQIKDQTSQDSTKSKDLGLIVPSDVSTPIDIEPVQGVNSGAITIQSATSN